MTTMINVDLTTIDQPFRLALAVQGCLIGAGYDPSDLFVVNGQSVELNGKRCLLVLVAKPGHKPGDTQNADNEFTINCGMLSETQQSTAISHWGHCCKQYNQLDPDQRHEFVMGNLGIDPSQVLFALISRGFNPTLNGK